MRKRLKKISVFQTSKVAAVLYGLLGLVFAPIFLVVGMFAPGSGDEAGLLGLGAGVAGAVLVPIFYAVFGFIGTAIACVLYNIIAGFIGGIEFELEDVSSY
jgi:hypothetical protein